MNGFENCRVSAAAADVALHAGGHISLGQFGILGEQLDSLHDHSGRAVAALERALSQEGFLDWVQLVALGQPFDGQNRLFLDVGHRRDAGSDALAVGEDSASATLALAAAVFGAGEVEVLAQDLQQRALRIGGDSAGLPIN